MKIFAIVGVLLVFAAVSISHADTVVVCNKVSLTNTDASVLFRAMESAKMQAKEDDMMTSIRGTVECSRLKRSELTAGTHDTTTPSPENFQCLVVQ